MSSDTSGQSPVATLTVDHAGEESLIEVLFASSVVGADPNKFRTAIAFFAFDKSGWIPVGIANLEPRPETQEPDSRIVARIQTPRLLDDKLKPWQARELRAAVLITTEG